MSHVLAAIVAEQSPQIAPPMRYAQNANVSTHDAIRRRLPTETVVADDASLVGLTAFRFVHLGRPRCAGGRLGKTSGRFVPPKRSKNPRYRAALNARFQYRAMGS